MTFYQGALRKLRMTDRIANVSYKVIRKRIEPQILYVVTSKMSKIFSSTAGKEIKLQSTLCKYFKPFKKRLDIFTAS